MRALESIYSGTRECFTYQISKDRQITGSITILLPKFEKEIIVYAGVVFLPSVNPKIEIYRGCFQNAIFCTFLFSNTCIFKLETKSSKLIVDNCLNELVTF